MTLVTVVRCTWSLSHQLKSYWTGIHYAALWTIKGSENDNGIGIKVYKVFMVHSGGKSFTVSFKEQIAHLAFLMGLVTDIELIGVST